MEGRAPQYFIAPQFQFSRNMPGHIVAEFRDEANNAEVKRSNVAILDCLLVTLSGYVDQERRKYLCSLSFECAGRLGSEIEEGC